MFSTIVSGSIILTQIVLPLLLSQLMGLVSFALHFKYKFELAYINLAICVIRYISIKCLISSNGEYDLIAKEINNLEYDQLDKPEIHRGEEDNKN
jgi:hypothetical protein